MLTLLSLLTLGVALLGVPTWAAVYFVEPVPRYNSTQLQVVPLKYRHPNCWRLNNKIVTLLPHELQSQPKLCICVKT